MVYNNQSPYDNKLIRLFYGYGWNQLIQYRDIDIIAFNKLVTDEESGYRYSISAYISKSPEDDSKNAICVDILTDIFKTVYQARFKLSFDMLNDDNFIHMINTWISIALSKYIDECHKGTVEIYPGTRNIETKEYEYPNETTSGYRVPMKTYQTMA